MGILLTRDAAAKYIGIDVKTFDKVFRNDQDFKRIKIGDHSERFTKNSINEFINLKEKNLKQIWVLVDYLLI